MTGCVGQCTTGPTLPVRPAAYKHTHTCTCTHTHTHTHTYTDAHTHRHTHTDTHTDTHTQTHTHTDTHTHRHTQTQTQTHTHTDTDTHTHRHTHTHTQTHTHTDTQVHSLLNFPWIHTVAASSLLNGANYSGASTTGERKGYTKLQQSLQLYIHRWVRVSTHACPTHHRQIITELLHTFYNESDIVPQDMVNHFRKDSAVDVVLFDVVARQLVKDLMALGG